MVAGAFPIAKLAYLAVKQVSKPLASSIKQAAKSNRLFRNCVCLPPAQFYHFVETRFKMYLLGFGKPTTVAPLNEQMAVELGAELLGEGIVFVAAAGTLVFEYMRQARNTKAKEDELEARLKAVETQANFLNELCEQQNKRLMDVQKQLNNSPSIFKSLTGKLKLNNNPSSAHNNPPKIDKSVQFESGNAENAEKSFQDTTATGNYNYTNEVDGNFKPENPGMPQAEQGILLPKPTDKNLQKSVGKFYHSPGYGLVYSQDLSYFDKAVYEASNLILGADIDTKLTKENHKTSD